MCTTSERILLNRAGKELAARQLFSRAETRALEAAASAQLPPHALMERAGLAIARLAMAIAPHARQIWIPAGPGNNGGDGLEAAHHLRLWGKEAIVTHIASPGSAPSDAMAARQKAIQTNVTFSDHMPEQYDLCIDALFGMGHKRSFDPQCTTLIRQINSKLAPVIAVDVPTGLDAETGATNGPYVRADFTLTLLTLKPGLFTGDGRDASGDVWFNSLDVPEPTTICAQLNPRPDRTTRAHNTHKGSYGDVCIVGGCQGMSGAALLAATAALHGGAGRVYVALLDPNHPHFYAAQPELMFRSVADHPYTSMTVVAGCGGGLAIQEYLESIMTFADHLVLDADALNALASTPELQRRLRQRTEKSTVLTPHPLEAARLMGISGAEVQANRLGVAREMAERFACTVVLKGSGTVIATPKQLPQINTTGNARLATAGTGDVLAGLIGARLAAGSDTFRAACEAVFRHGQIADAWDANTTMSAGDLARAL
jgi:hydroxyethylthiazole kinase-like uncharacterized protein yjeF